MGTWLKAGPGARLGRRRSRRNLRGKNRRAGRGRRAQWEGKGRWADVRARNGLPQGLTISGDDPCARGFGAAVRRRDLAARTYWEGAFRHGLRG